MYHNHHLNFISFPKYRFKPPKKKKNKPHRKSVSHTFKNIPKIIIFQVTDRNPLPTLKLKIFLYLAISTLYQENASIFLQYYISLGCFHQNNKILGPFWTIGAVRSPSLI